MFDLFKVRSDLPYSTMSERVGPIELRLRCEATPGAALIEVPGDGDRWLYAALTLAHKLGERPFETLDEHLADSKGERPFRLSTLGAIPSRLCVLETTSGFSAFPEIDDIYRDADQDACQWFSDHATLRGGLSDNAAHLEPRNSSLINLWNQLGQDPARFALAHAASRLGISITPLVLNQRDQDVVLREVLARLDSPERRLFEQLRVHSRALPQELIPRTFSHALDELRGLGIVDVFGGDVSIAAPWSGVSVPLEHTSDIRSLLANWFAECAANSALQASLRGLAALEAHRHLAATGTPEDLQRSLSFAKYGVRLVLRAAVNISRSQRDPGRARRLYSAVLAAHREARTQGGLLGPRALAYTLHYEAENRRREENPRVEPPVLAGFRQSIALWPQNAHFWEHLIEALAQRGDLVGAREARDQALITVNRSHPDCTMRLVRNPILQVIEKHPWIACGLATHPPEELDLNILAQIERRLTDGLIVSRRFWTPPAFDLAFKEPLLLRVLRASGGGFVAETRGVEMPAPDILNAWNGLVARIADVVESQLCSRAPALGFPPLDVKFMRRGGPRSRWLAGLASVARNQGPAARLLRRSWDSVFKRGGELPPEDRPSLELYEAGHIELAWCVMLTDGARGQIVGDLAPDGTAEVALEDPDGGPRSLDTLADLHKRWIEALQGTRGGATERSDQALIDQVLSVLDRSRKALLWCAPKEIGESIALEDGTPIRLPPSADGAVVFVDLEPHANWAHPCAIVTCDANGSLPPSVHHTSWPPEDLLRWRRLRS